MSDLAGPARSANRDIALDLLKVLAIFGVLLIHASGLYGYGGRVPDPVEIRDGLFFIGLSTFCIPVFVMVHNWADSTVVRPRTGGVVEEGGVFLNNYVLLKPVKDLQSYPAIRLNGRGAVARFNSVIVAPKGSYVDSGSRIELNAPDTRGEIISRTIASGGTIVARGFIGGNSVPAKGHLECKGLILGGGVIHAIPELLGTVDGVELSHGRYR